MLQKLDGRDMGHLLDPDFLAEMFVPSLWFNQSSVTKQLDWTVVEYRGQDRALARERTTGLSMMPLRKIRSMSLASVPDGNSFRLSNTCCMALKKKKKKRIYRAKNIFIRNFNRGDDSGN